jgi:hypothetical protein
MGSSQMIEPLPAEPNHGHDAVRKACDEKPVSSKPSNEYVLVSGHFIICTLLPLKQEASSANDIFFCVFQNIAFASFLGFTLLQTFFTLLARSEAMMADCAAMSVDAVTYLFNYCAERLKHRKLTEKEKALSHDVLHRRLKLHRLYLELFPPLLSVTTLLTVTVVSLKKAMSTLRKGPDDEEEGPDVMIMLVFSAMNLVLDAVNVTCFARADQAQGLPTTVFQHHPNPAEGSEISAELTRLLGQPKEKEGTSSQYDATDSESHTVESADDESSQDSEGHLNLNMCSAWTVRYFFSKPFGNRKRLLSLTFYFLRPQNISISARTLFVVSQYL